MVYRANQFDGAPCDAGEHKSEEILKLNPRGQVPTFVDGDVVVNESLAALLYIQDKYPSPSLLPATVEGRALVSWQQHNTPLVNDTNLTRSQSALYTPTLAVKYGHLSSMWWLIAGVPAPAGVLQPAGQGDPGYPLQGECCTLLKYVSIAMPTDSLVNFGKLMRAPIWSMCNVCFACGWLQCSRKCTEDPNTM